MTMLKWLNAADGRTRTDGRGRTEEEGGSAITNTFNAQRGGADAGGGGRRRRTRRRKRRRQAGTTMNNRFTFFAALEPFLFARSLIQHAESNQGACANWIDADGIDVGREGILKHPSERDM